MAKSKQEEPKVTLEREYTVPLRSKWLKVPKYKRANKATKALKEFIARHMKVYDRDLRKIKLDLNLNNEIRFRGMKKPPAKIKVKATKYENEIVRVNLVELPAPVKFERLRREKKKAKLDKKVKAKEESTQQQVKVEKEKTDDKKDLETKEKEKTSIDETLKLAKDQAKGMKHLAKDKKIGSHRKALAK